MFITGLRATPHCRRCVPNLPSAHVCDFGFSGRGFASFAQWRYLARLEDTVAFSFEGAWIPASPVAGDMGDDAGLRVEGRDGASGCPHAARAAPNVHGRGISPD